ncbi:unnamed protein product [Staurois parvus]|uniref:Uncharacterized protein n=1 Tax=Staurois parvus TaxID=386267 RepID=A0ABN9CYA9_9NEOB|nr:unnamed protein product [Staurois parvus]
MLLARPVICQGPIVPGHPHAACQVQSVSMGFPANCLLNCCGPPSPHLCHVPHSGLPHTAGGFHFCHRELIWPLHCCSGWGDHPPPHCGSTLWFWPRDLH